jgi:hypothetical protein
MKPMPVTGYDARAIEEYYDLRPLEVGWRLNTLGFPLLGTFRRAVFVQKKKCRLFLLPSDASCMLDSNRVVHRSAVRSCLGNRWGY